MKTVAMRKKSKYEVVKALVLICIAAIVLSGCGGSDGGGKTTVATAPFAVNAACGDSKATISWTAPADDGGAEVTDYKIYRGTSPDSMTYLENTGSVLTSYCDTSAENGVTYYYCISAVNALGGGVRCEPVCVTPEEGEYVASPPQSLNAIPGENKVSLSWDAPLCDGNSAITGYTVYRGDTSGDLYELALVEYTAPKGVTGSEGTGVPEPPVAPEPPVLLTSYEDESVSNGTEYFYAVTAINAIGESVESSEKAVTPRPDPTVPPTPQNLTVSMVVEGSLDVQWLFDPSDDGGSEITNHIVYRRVVGDNFMFLDEQDDFDKSGAWSFNEQTGIVTYRDINVANGTEYLYAVAVENAIGESAKSNVASATPSTKPGKPESLTASHGNSRVNLDWSKPSSDGGAEITAYIVYRCEGTDLSGLKPITGPDAKMVIIPEGVATDFEDKTVANGTLYSYVVTAVNLRGESVQSDSDSATPQVLATVPGAPKSLKAESGDKEITLTGFTPSDDGGSDILGYNIYQDSPTRLSMEHLSVGAVGEKIEIKFLNNGTTYYVQVSAVNTIGEGPKSDWISVIPSTTPQAPIALIAKSGDSEIDLSWTAPEDNGGASIVDYKIYRKTGSEGTWEDYDNVVGTETTLDTTFHDGVVENGTTYYYKVVAINVKGLGVDSDEANATPVVTPGAPDISNLFNKGSYIQVDWNAPLGSGGSGELGMDLELPGMGLELPPASDGSEITGYRIYMGRTNDPDSLSYDTEQYVNVQYHYGYIYPPSSWFNQAKPKVTGGGYSVYVYVAVSAVNAAGVEGPKSVVDSIAIYTVP